MFFSRKRNNDVNVNVIYFYKLTLNCTMKVLAVCPAYISSISKRQASNFTLFTVVGTATHEKVIKKSKFRSIVGEARSVTDAEKFILNNRDEHATHTCWAYRVIDDIQRSSDDGEPSGTAGGPIFNAIRSNHLTNTVVVVSRFYGGIKLGTGGLMRAYGGAAQSCISMVPKLEYRVFQKATINTNSNYYQVVLSVIQNPNYSITKVSEDYTDDSVIFSINFPMNNKSAIEAALLNYSQGNIKLSVNISI